MEIIEATKTVGTFESAKQIEMSIDMESIADIMQSLTAIYKNNHWAILREYTSNAFDSHIKANQTVPVEVILPTELSPNLIIRDHGTGMSHTELVELYSRFGKTTKKNENNQIGAYGLGSKSALSVAGAYTFTSIKDGKLNRVIVAQGDTGIPVFNFMEETETDKGNGVEISIPATPEDIEGYSNAVKNGVFFAWKHGTITVNGSTSFGVNNLWDTNQWDKLSDNVFVAKSSTRRGYWSKSFAKKVTIVVGPVSYQIDDETQEKLIDELVQQKLGLTSQPHSYRDWAVRIPNGSVAFVRSRDTFIFNNNTREVIATAMVEAFKLELATKQAEIDTAATYVEAITKLSEESFSPIGNRELFTYNNKPLGGLFYLYNLKSSSLSRKVTSIQVANGRSQQMNRMAFTDKVVLVTNYNPNKKFAGFGLYAELVADNVNETVKMMLVEGSIEEWDSHLVGNPQIVDYSEVQNVVRTERNRRNRINRAGRTTSSVIATTKIFKTYDRFSIKSFEAAPENVLNKKFVIFDLTNKELSKLMLNNTQTSYKTSVNKVLDEMIIAGYVFVQTNKRCTKEHVIAGLNAAGNTSGVVTFDEAYESFMAVQIVEALKAEPLMVASKHQNLRPSRDISMDLTKIKNPKTAEWMKSYIGKADSEVVKEIIAHPHFITSVANRHITEKQKERLTVLVEKVKKVKQEVKNKYPMLSLINSYNLDAKEVVDYINLVDESSKK